KGVMKVESQKVKLEGTRQRLALLLLLLIFASVSTVKAQEPQQQSTTPQSPRKSNERTSAPSTQAKKPEPFDGATVAKMAEQCVTLQTESGQIVIEMLAEAAPETARNFLNLVSTGSFDTTTFSRVVKGFVIQGGNLSTSQYWGATEGRGAELLERARRKIMDEPNYIKHVRGIVSMARPETPNGASTHFFILVSEEAPTLDNKFAAFGRVIKGMEVVDAINNMQTEGDKPVKPVRVTRATAAQCVK
ncbi:MAG TPA: peptidylprolyl isomerase, partial [Pyrinomonadaceae bacterium]|nr:peptidylprolyl isomerase [Pyrinomonadaceae bacterium]